jgi:murein L,D-transpeptidase YcbB/YkuD
MGWPAVDEEVKELRRHFHSAQTVQDYRNIGNDCVAVLEALSATVYDLTRHLRPGETEPAVAQTKQRLERYADVALPGAGNAEIRALVKKTIEFAQAVKHNPDGTRARAGIAADAVIQLANILRRLADNN